MELLWGVEEEPKRGRKRTLSLRQVVESAVRLADEVGFETLSMRAIAQDLGVGAMSLYTYVPGKAELLDLMMDHVYGEYPLPKPTGEWRSDAVAFARADWELYLRHPWLLRIADSRATFGPNELASGEALVSCLIGIGLSARDIGRVVELIYVFTRGAARILVDSRAVEAETGTTDTQWWEERFSYIAPQFPNRFPALTAIYGEAFADIATQHPDSYLDGTAQDTFQFGLDVILDGIETRLNAVAADDSPCQAQPPT